MSGSDEKRSDGRKKGDPKKQDRRPWRDNIEAVTMAIVMAVMLKYFIVEAYQIPTGSMQPTLMGNDETDVHDRILVDKLSYHFRDPVRWEVAVFKYPLDLSKNFIKRICGVGPEELRISGGDLWHREDPREEWEILRRPRPVQLEVWKELYPGRPRCNRWRQVAGATPWQVADDTIAARGDGSLRFPSEGSVVDDFRDGYPLGMRDLVRLRSRPPGRNTVGDLRVDGEVKALAGCEAVRVRFTEGTRHFTVELPGPAAKELDRPRILSSGAAAEALGARAPTASLDEPWRLPEGRRVSFAAQNMDDRVTLELDGEVVLELDVPSAEPGAATNLLLQVDGEGADFADVMVYRDIYYLTEGAKKHQWTLEEGEYVMLGDNTQDSSDSREWTFARFGAWPGFDGDVLRGNQRLNNENPRRVPGGPAGTVVWLRDEFGELRHAPEAAVERLPEELATTVDRELITGRALVVFWPVKWKLGFWRLEWIH